MAKQVLSYKNLIKGNKPTNNEGIVFLLTLYKLLVLWLNLRRGTGPGARTPEAKPKADVCFILRLPKSCLFFDFYKFC